MRITTPKNPSDRVRKQGRYSALTTLTMRMMKQVDRSLYESEEGIAHAQDINRQKNYYIIVMRICRTYSYLLGQLGYTKQRAVNYIHKFLKDLLNGQVDKKYHTQAELIQQIKKKNHYDLTILITTFQCDLNSFSSIKSHLSQIYQTNSLRQHHKQLKKLTDLFIKYSQTSIDEDDQMVEEQNKKQSTKISVLNACFQDVKQQSNPEQESENLEYDKNAKQNFKFNNEESLDSLELADYNFQRTSQKNNLLEFDDPIMSDIQSFRQADIFLGIFQII